MARQPDGSSARYSVIQPDTSTARGRADDRAAARHVVRQAAERQRQARESRGDHRGEAAMLHGQRERTRPARGGTLAATIVPLLLASWLVAACGSPSGNAGTAAAPGAAGAPAAP